MNPLQYFIMIIALIVIFIMLEDAEAHDQTWVLRVETITNIPDTIWLKPYNQWWMCKESQDLIEQYNKAAQIKATIRCTELK